MGPTTCSISALAHLCGGMMAQLCQLPIFLIAPRGVCSVPSLLMSKS